MLDLFWRRRIRKQAKSFYRGLPNLPDDIDDNLFLTQAVQAAAVDKSRGAFDEFMFSEDGYTDMPFEVAVDDFLNLQKTRIPERESRSLLELELETKHLEKVAAHKRSMVDSAHREVDETKALIEHEKKILSGQQKGEDGLDWRGEAPDVTSRSRHLSRRLLEIIVFLVVAGVDFVVTLVSLQGVVGKNEAQLFLAPVIGVQILFPHLAGKALGRVRRSGTKKSFDKWLFVSVAVAWVLYAIAMTLLRYNVLISYFSKTNTEDTPLMRFAILMLSLFLLIGFGLWIGIRAMRDNPHETRYSRLKFILKSKQNKLARKIRAAGASQVAAENSKNLLAKKRGAFGNQVNRFDVLGTNTKSTYRRALVNEVGDPEFTTKYIPLDEGTRALILKKVK